MCFGRLKNFGMRALSPQHFEDMVELFSSVITIEESVVTLISVPFKNNLLFCSGLFYFLALVSCSFPMRTDV